MTTANKITITRILMIPVFVMLAIYYGKSIQLGEPNEWYHAGAVLVFVLAALSDGLDGYIARKYNQRSQLGIVLDPIADKGLLLAAIITLSVSKWHYEFPLWFPVVVIFRDIVGVAGALLLKFLTGHVKVQVSWMGKIATALQMVAISLVLLQLDFLTGLHAFDFAGARWEWLDVPVLLAGVFTLLSALGYFMDGIRQLQTSGHDH